MRKFSDWNFRKRFIPMFKTLFLPAASVFYSMCYLSSNQDKQRRMIYTTKLFIRYIPIHFLSH